MNKYVSHLKVLFACAAVILVGTVATKAYFSSSATISSNTFGTGYWTPTPSPSPSPDLSQNVAINELMWSGSTVSSDDEWIELRNLTSNPIDISGWQITKLVTTEQPMLTIPSGSIPANGYFLISKFGSGDSNSALNVSPDLLGSVGLRNSNLRIKLYSGAISPANLVDTADDGAGVPLAGYDGGEQGPRKSMSRQSPPGDGTLGASWFTDATNTGVPYWDVTSTGNYGTPGGPNV